MRLALVCAAAFLALPAHAVDVLTFVGKLGNRDIVVELTPPEAGAVAGRYTFMDTGGDIPLVAVSHGPILESAQKIDPTAGAGYILNDHQGMRYFYIDYNKESE